MTLSPDRTESVRTRLAEIVGPSHLLSGDQASMYSLDGEQPVAVVFPADEREVAEVARLADRERATVIPWGAGTRQGVEPVQPRDGIILGTQRLAETVELDAANLTVTVGAGKIVDDLQRELAEAKLFLPLDPVDSARSTLGGTLATNSSGSNRLLYRTARDWVLGLRVVTPAGNPLRAGGKTVKDVAGYDLKKLYIGSWGTLGAISEATFRLLPLPEVRATVATLFPSLSGACATVSKLLASFMRASTADLLSEDVASPMVRDSLQPESGDYLLLVSFEGVQEAVQRQTREFRDLAAVNSARECAILEGAREAELWKQRKGALLEPPRGKAAMLVKASVSIQRILDFVGSVAERSREQGIELSTASHAGNGVVYVRMAVDRGQQEKLVAAAGQVQQLAANCGGFAMVQRAPRAVLQSVRLWPPRSDYGLMWKVKAQLDPINLWNPARTPGGVSGT